MSKPTKTELEAFKALNGLFRSVVDQYELGSPFLRALACQEFDRAIRQVFEPKRKRR